MQWSYKCLVSKQESYIADSCKFFPYLLNVYSGWLIHLYCVEEKCMECKANQCYLKVCLLKIIN